MTILPALKAGDKIVTHPESHAEAIKAAIRDHGWRGETLDAEKGFLIDGTFYNRRDAARITGLPTNLVPGLLHSEDLKPA
jgi:predicted homoserine dehydrogenase-like protein